MWIRILGDHAPSFAKGFLYININVDYLAMVLINGIEESMDLYHVILDFFFISDAENS